MKTILNLLFLIAILPLMNGCIAPSEIDAGEEGVLIYKPWVFGSGGVDNTPIETGLTWTVWSTSVARYDIKPVKITEKFIDLTAKDNVAIDFNAYLTLQIEAGLTPILHEKSGIMWYKNKVEDFFRTAVRNEGRTRTSIELRTNPAIITEAQETIKQKMRDYFVKVDLPVRVIKVIIGKVIPPDEVLRESERTAAQKQREQTQTARAKAELTRALAETNAAKADKAYATQFKMSTAQFLKNKELDIMSRAVEKGGVSLIMNASNSTPFFNVRK